MYFGGGSAFTGDVEAVTIAAETLYHAELVKLAAAAKKKITYISRLL